MAQNNKGNPGQQNQGGQQGGGQQGGGQRQDQQNQQDPKRKIKTTRTAKADNATTKITLAKF
jgi:hypothetical protein